MSADFTIRIHASEPLLEVLRGVATSLAELARAIGGPAAAARPREEEPLKIRPDPPLRENGPAMNSPAFVTTPADDGGGADAMLSPAHDCRVTGPTRPDVSSQTSPAAATPPAAFSKRVTTPEREAALLAMKADGKSNKEIRAALNLMPGKPVSVGALDDWLWKLRKDGKLPRGAVAGPAMTAADVVARREAAPVAAPVAAAVKHQVLETRLPAEPVRVDYEQARSWAAQRGLVSRHETLDMEKVNAKRRELGLGIFVAREKADAHRFARRVDA